MSIDQAKKPPSHLMLPGGLTVHDLIRLSVDDYEKWLSEFGDKLGQEALTTIEQARKAWGKLPAATKAEQTAEMPAGAMALDHSKIYAARKPAQGGTK